MHDKTARHDSLVDTSSYIIYFPSVFLEKRRLFAWSLVCGWTTSSKASIRNFTCNTTVIISHFEPFVIAKTLLALLPTHP